MRFAKNKLLNPAIFKNSLGTSTQLPIAPFKSTIKSALAQLKEHQNNGVSAAELIEKYTWMIDELVIIAWEHHSKHHPVSSTVELIAVGGYGRRELHPYSDVDLLILLADEDYDAAQEVFD